MDFLQAKSNKMMNTWRMPVVFNYLHWLSTILLIVLGCYTFKKATTRTGFLLCSFFLLLSGWGLGAALVFNIDGLETKIELTRMKFMFIPFLSVNVFYLARCFSDKVRLTKSEILAIGIIPALAVIIICSPYHSLLVNNYAIENYRGSDILTYGNGPLFQIYVIHSRIIFLWALYTLIKVSINNHLIRKTAWIIFFSILIPLVLDAVAVSFFPILRYIQIVPVVLTFTALCFYYVVFKEKILDLIPIARTQVIDSISDIYLVIDDRNRLVDFNTYAKHALQLNSLHIGRFLRDIHSDAHGILSHLSEMIEQRQTKSIYVVPGHNHKEFYSIRFDSIVSKVSEEMGQVIMVKNITEHKKYETQLAQIVTLRTKFISIIAHDLIGNVSGHTLFLESLMDHKGVQKDEDLKASLDFLLNSSQNITKFVEGLLSWSRENLNDMQIKKIKTDLNLLINDAIHFLQPIAIQKDIEYDLQVAPNSYADIDPDMIQTVFRNIIANAIKVSPESSIVTIKVDVGHELINVSIADQGIGVDEATINNFLTQLNLDSFNGGFGLTLSRDFIHLHKGFISAKNNTPKGAIFSFTLPKLND